MTWERSGLVAWVEQAVGSADYRLHVQVAPERGSTHHAGAEVTTLRLDDPMLGERLRDVAQAFRMGVRTERGA